MRGHSNISRRGVAAWAGLVVLLAVGAFADPGLTLTMAPALLMIALFSAGIRPGEQLLIRAVQQAQAGPLRAVSSRRPRLAIVVRPTGRDLASALAMRPPPAAIVVV